MCWLARSPVLGSKDFLGRGELVRGVGSRKTKIKKAQEQIALVISILNLLSH